MTHDVQRWDVTSVSLPTFIVACTCATLGMMTSLSFLVFHVYHRENKIVKMSSPYMNMLTGFGAILLCAVCFLFGVDFLLPESYDVQSALCQARHWLTVHAITLVFGPVTVKAWRVNNIFKYGFAKKVVIKDRKLFGIIAVMNVVDAILMTSWQTTDPVIVQHRIFLDKKFEEYDMNASITGQTRLLIECTCNKYPIWSTVHTLWKIVLIFTCLYFSWKTRTVSIPCLNEASLAFSTVFASVLITFSAAIVVTSLRGRQDAVYIISTIALSACVILIQVILFFPRVRYWWKTPNDVTPKLSRTSLKDMPPFPLGDVNENMYHEGVLVGLVEENKELKESIEQKNAEITDLQGRLNVSKSRVFELPTEAELKQDSGLEADNSSGSHDVIDEVIPTQSKNSDRSHLYSVEPSPRGAAKTADKGSHQPNVHHLDSQSVDSAHSSDGFVHNFTDIRQTAESKFDNTWAHLQDNGNMFSEMEWHCESHDKPEIAGSIAQSYNLDLADDKEIMSYLNSCVPREKYTLKIQKARRCSTSSAFSLPTSDGRSTRCVEADDISVNLPSLSRDSATPNSQQHAAILRYYTHRHEVFKGFKQYRSNHDLLPPSGSSINKPSKRLAPNKQVDRNRTRIHSNGILTTVPNSVQNTPRTFQNCDCFSDSFV